MDANQLSPGSLHDLNDGLNRLSPPTPLEAATANFPTAPLHASASVSRQVVFIDSGVTDYESLVADIAPDTDVVLLNGATDGIAQISAYLAQYQGISAVHIVSHGTSGQLQLGNTPLNLDTLAGYASSLQGWAQSLTDDADILLYGCDVGAGVLGQAFVQSLSQLTGADIAASNNLTGSAALGGDWLLEVNTGEIAANIAFQATQLNGYMGTLAAVDSVQQGLDVLGDRLAEFINTNPEFAAQVPGVLLRTANSTAIPTMRNLMELRVDRNGDGQIQLPNPVLTNLSTLAGIARYVNGEDITTPTQEQALNAIDRNNDGRVTWGEAFDVLVIGRIQAAAPADLPALLSFIDSLTTPTVLNGLISLDLSALAIAATPANDFTLSGGLALIDNQILDLGAAADGQKITLLGTNPLDPNDRTPKVPVSGGLGFAGFVFTLDAADNLTLTPPAPNAIQAGINIGATPTTPLPIAFDSTVGFLGTQTTGSVELRMTINGSLIDPNSNGSITLPELQNTAIATLITASQNLANSKLDINLQFTVDPGIGFAATGDLAIQVANPFTAPTTTLNGRQRFNLALTPAANFAQFLDFNVVSASEFLSLLQQFQGWLDRLPTTETFGQYNIPFAQAALGELLDFGDLLEDGLIFDDGDNGIGGTGVDINKLLQKNADNSLSLTFGTAQQLAQRLGSIPGITLGGVNYNTTSKELTFNLSFAHQLTGIERTANFDLTALAPLAEVQTTSSLQLQANAQFNGTIGLRLGNNTATLDATTPLSTLNANSGIDLTDQFAITTAADVSKIIGQLSADASFSVQINGGAAINVVLPAANTSTNRTLTDLLADLNTAINGTALNGRMIAEMDGLRVRLRAIDPTVTGFTVNTTSTNPAFTELGLQPGNAIAGRLLIASNNITSALGQLSADTSFTLTINGTPTTINLSRLNTVTNTSIASLVEDLNGALNAAGVANRIRASWNGSQIVLRAVDNSVTSFSVSAAAELGFGNQTATTDLSSLAGREAPYYFGPLTNANFTVVVTGGTAAGTRNVTLTRAAARNNASMFDLLVDINDALNTAFGGSTTNPLQASLDGNRIVLKAKNGFGVSGFTVTASSATDTAATDLGFRPFNPADPLTLTANRADLMIFTRDGSAYQITLRDGSGNPLTTVGDVLNAIATQTGGKVTAITSGPRLLLTDNSAAGSATFRVDRVNGSPVAFQLGIFGQGQQSFTSTPTANIIEGGAIAGSLQLSDRFFVRQLNPGTDLLSANITVSTPSGINASARFGFLGVELEGNGSLTGQVGVGLANPSGTLTLTDLFNGLDLNGDGSTSFAELSSIIDGPNLTGSGNFTLELKNSSINELEAILPGSTFGGNPRLQITVNSLGNPFATPAQLPNIDIQTFDFNNFANFELITFDNVLAVLQQAASFLNQFADLDALGAEIPGIGLSVNELLDVANRFNTAVTEIQQNPAGTLQTLEQKVRETFGLPAGANIFSLSLKDLRANGNPANFTPDGAVDTLQIILNLGSSFSDGLPLEIDLSSSVPAALQSLLGDLHLLGSAGLQGSGSLNARLGLGVDLLNPNQLYLFDGETEITGTIAATGNNLTFNASLGPIGVFVTGGQATFGLNLGFENAGAGANSFVVIANPADLVTAFNNFDINFNGTANINLPVFAPTESNYVGDIGLVATVGLDAGNNLVTSANATVPDSIFDLDFENFGLIDNIFLAIDGLDLFLTGIQEILDGQVFGFDLPLIGDSLSDGAEFIEDLRRGLIRPFRNFVETASDRSEEFIQRLLFAILGPGDAALGITTGLGILLKADGSGPATSYTDIDIDGGLNGDFIQWNVRIGQRYTPAVDLDFDLGLPGLGLDVNADLDFTLGWDLGLGIGISRQDGAYLDIGLDRTLNYGGDAIAIPELAVTLDVQLNRDPGLPPGTPMALGQLGFLQLNVNPADTDGDGILDPTRLGAVFTIDLINRNNTADTRLGFTELSSLGAAVNLGADAEVNFDLTAKFNEALLPPSVAAVLPSVNTQFVLDWEVGNLVSGNLSGINTNFNLADGLKLIEFRNVALDLGSFLSDFLQPVVAKIQEITQPIQPIIDILTQPIPVISDLAGRAITLVDIAEIFGNVDLGFIESIAELVSFVNSIPTDVENLLLPIGSFKLFDANGGGLLSGAGDFANPNFNLSGVDISSLSVPNFSQLLNNLDAATRSRPTTGSVERVVTAGLQGQGGFSFPFLENPTSIFGLLLGQDITLVTYDMAPLVMQFNYRQSFPIYPPLFAVLSGTAGVTIDLAFGYDTKGVRNFADGGFQNPLDLGGGFFISDTNLPDGTFGVDVPEVVLSAGIFAGAELNLGIASGGVEGGITADINFNLFDPDRDGKVRIEELVGNFLYEFYNGSPALAPLAIFDVSGQVAAQLRAFIEFLFFEETFEITPPIVLAEFNIEFDREPILATERGDGSLLLNIGPNASARLNGDTRDISEEIFVKSENGKLLVWAPMFGVSEANAQEYSGNRIVAFGGEGNDRIILTGTNVDVEVDGGVGNDEIRAGSGRATLFGGLGNDILFGGSNADTINGGEGDDRIDGGAGNDRIFGDDGSITQNRFIRAAVGEKDGNDIISGGAGDDIIFGGGGNDVIVGEQGNVTATPFTPSRDDTPAANGNDIIFGDGGRMALGGADGFTPDVNDISGTDFGAGGNDTLFGQSGRDRIYGGAGDDLIDGGAGDDFRLDGGKGFDTVAGGGGADIIDGGSEDDQLYGFRETGDDPTDGGDTINGGDGNDFIRGHGGADQIRGGRGADIIFGDRGNDNILGENDPDFIFGGADNDTIDGGAGNDVVFGDDGLVVFTNVTPGVDRIIGDGNPALIGGFVGDTNPATMDLILTEVNAATDGSDRIIGGTGDDYVLGGAQNDIIFGDFDPENVPAGPLPTGQDVLIGDGGRIEFFNRRLDRIATEPGAFGSDTISGNDGNDYILGGSSGDTLYGRQNPTLPGAPTPTVPDNDIILGDDGEIDFTNGVMTRIISDRTATATGGADTAYGNEGDDIIFGGVAGDTVLRGNAGDDIIFGDNGEILFVNGVISSITTTDTTAATGGADTAIGDTGNDIILGGVNGTVANARDILNGDDGDDIILGDNGRLLYDDGDGDLTTLDLIESVTFDQGGADLISGNAGADIVLGGTGDDAIYGDATAPGEADSDDILLGDNGRVTLQGGIIARIETLAPAIGGDDTIRGNAGGDRILGGFGNDNLAGNDGNDIILGDNGLLDYTIDGDRSTIDLITTTDGAIGGNDTITGDAGDDIALGGAGNDDIAGNAGADILLGDNGQVVYDGTAITRIATIDPGIGGSDTIRGNAGADIILGGAAGDAITGNADNDIILGDNGLLNYGVDSDLTTLDLITTTDPDVGGNDTIQGNDGDDIALGGAANDTISGNAGRDLLVGDNGRIIHTGGVIRLIETIDPDRGGSDTISGNEDDDLIAGGFAGDWLNGNDGSDIILGDNGIFDYAYAGDSFVAGDTDLRTLDFFTTTNPTLGGNDTIYGGLGSDTVMGGTGSDVIYGDEGVDTLDANWQVVATTDFNGDGSPDLLWHNRQTGEALIWYMNRDRPFAAAALPDVPLTFQIEGAADFNNDGQVDLVVRDRTTGQVSIWLPNPTGYQAIAVHVPIDFGWDLAALGDINNNGDIDLIWRNRADGLNVVWYMDNTNYLGYAYLPPYVGADWNIVGSGDFDRDGRTDLMWRNQNTGENTVWYMNGTNYQGFAFLPGAGGVNLNVAGIGDFNQDGFVDLAWYNQATHQTTIWYLNNTAYQGFTPAAATSRQTPQVTGSNWQIVATGDFNNDGLNDFAWRNSLTGENALWLMNGSVLKQEIILPQVQGSTWNIMGAFDINNDGFDDLIWRNQESGLNTIWFLNSSGYQGHILLPEVPGANWNIVQVADMDNDGFGDVVWRNQDTGLNSIWFLNATGYRGHRLLPEVPGASWNIVGTFDFNNDGFDDLVWRDQQSGLNSIWFLNSTGYQGHLLLPEVPGASWNIVGVFDFNNDGFGDLVWRDQQSGLNSIWFLNSSGYASHILLPAVPDPDWAIARVIDMNNDGFADIVWRNRSSSESTVWFLNNNGYQQYAYVQTGVEANDLLMGDHGKVYRALPIGRNFFSIDTDASAGGGNDVIFGNQGDDFIMGQQGDDNLFGGLGEDDMLGGHNVIGGADGGDFMDGGADEDVMLGDNGMITRRLLGYNLWERYPAPFDAVIRDVVRYDDIDRIGGNDLMRGGSGDDIMHGQRGNDSMFGNAGDDEMYGQLGNDYMSGGSGQDTMLGDVGIITRAYNPDGTPRLNTNGSWHRDAILTDVGRLTTTNSGSLATNLFQTADLMLLTGAYDASGNRVLNPDGTWRTEIQTVSLYDDGDDFMLGDDGDDAMFGQRGNDTMQGGNGQDFIQGNAGDDQISGDVGDDFLMGDEGNNLTGFNRDIPHVVRGIHLIDRDPGVSIDLGQYGTVVTPNLTLVPHMTYGLLPTLTFAPELQRNNSPVPPIAPLDAGGGTVLSVLAAITPDLTHHLDLLAGNDIISGGTGRDEIVGDTYTSFMPLRTGVSSFDQGVDQLTRSLYQLVYDLHDLELGNTTSGGTFNLGNDAIDGGDDTDTVMGDNAMTFGPLPTQIPNSGNLSSLLADLGAVLANFSGIVNALMPGASNPATATVTLSMGNDVIAGGNGDDRLYADDNVLIAPLLNALPYQPNSFWQYNVANTVRPARSTFRDFNLQLGNDIVSGGEGNDLSVGGYSTTITPIITAPTTNPVLLQQSLDTLAEDVKAFVRNLFNDRHGIDYTTRDQSNSLIAQNDTLNGDGGDDLLLGDNSTFVLPFLNGQVNLSIELNRGNFDYGDQSHNFFHALPHQYDYIYRNPATGFTQLAQDIMTGGDGNDIMFGFRGIDQLSGNGGFDYLFGGEDADTLNGGAENDVIRNTNPSPGDAVAITNPVRARLTNPFTPITYRYLQDVAQANNALALTGNLFINTPG